MANSAALPGGGTFEDRIGVHGGALKIACGNVFGRDSDEKRCCNQPIIKTIPALNAMHGIVWGKFCLEGFRV